MSVVDASVWVSRLYPNDIFHEASSKWLTEAIEQRQPLLAPTLMLAEVAGALARQTGDGQLAQELVERIQRLQALQLVPLDRELADRAVTIAAQHQLRGADAVYVALAQHSRQTLISWDNEHLSRAGRIVDCRSPKIIP